MKKGDIAKLQMQKMLRIGEQAHACCYTCSILKYDERQECIYLVLEQGDLTEMSLDAVYRCEIQSETEKIGCTGRIQERYCELQGNILKFRIENGFYKINLKCVDKQRA